MTTLNTIIEEKIRLLDEKFTLTASDGKKRKLPQHEFVLNEIRTAMQRAYEAGQSEERAKIREEVIEMFRAVIEQDIRIAQRTNTPIMVAGKALVQTLAKLTPDKTK